MAHILIDLTLTPPGGARTYAVGLIRGLTALNVTEPHTLTIAVERRFRTEHCDALTELEQTGVRVRTVESRAPGRLSATWRRGRDIAAMVREDRFDLVFVPRDVTPRLRVPTAILLRNLHAWAGWEGATGRRRAYLLLRRYLARRSARRASVVLAVSQVMASAAGFPNAVIVHHGCELPLGRQRERVQARPFRLLAVGNITPHKRLEMAIRATALLRELGHSVELSIVGKSADHRYTASLRELSLSLLGDDALCGPATLPELEEIYGDADALLVTTDFESFCHPLVEGMRSGCAVIAPDTELVREICGDVAVTYRPRDVEDLAAATIRALTDLEARSASGLARSQGFTWRAAAYRTVAALTRGL